MKKGIALLAVVVLIALGIIASATCTTTDTQANVVSVRTGVLSDVRTWTMSEKAMVRRFTDDERGVTCYLAYNRGYGNASLAIDCVK